MDEGREGPEDGAMGGSAKRKGRAGKKKRNRTVRGPPAPDQTTGALKWPGAGGKGRGGGGGEGEPPTLGHGPRGKKREEEGKNEPFL